MGLTVCPLFPDLILPQGTQGGEKKKLPPDLEIQNVGVTVRKAGQMCQLLTSRKQVGGNELPVPVEAGIPTLGEGALAGGGGAEGRV